MNPGVLSVQNSRVVFVAMALVAAVAGAVFLRRGSRQPVDPNAPEVPLRNPFSLTPDPRFIFASRSHDEALATLRYWVEHREGFVMVTGEVGTGKTTSLFRLIDNLEQRFEIAIFADQLRRGFHADARHARHVVGGIADQRLHLDDLFRRHAEFLDHLVAADALGLHTVEHRDARAHELHQILVRRDDRHIAADVDRSPRIRRDKIVRLVAIEFDARDVERSDCVANERKLRNEFFRRRRTFRPRDRPQSGRCCARDRVDRLRGHLQPRFFIEP